MERLQTSLLFALLFVGFMAVAGEQVNSMFSQAHFYYARGQYEKASSTIIKAYRLAEREFRGQYVLSDYAYDVAAVHQNIGSYDIAEKYHLINLEIKKRHLKLPSGQLIYAYNNVASVKILKRQYKEAIAILLDLDASTNRQRVEEMAYVYSNLARGYLGVNNLHQAEEYLNRALNYFEKSYSDQDIVVSDVRFTKAKLLREQGKVEEASAIAGSVLTALRSSGYADLPFYKEVSEFVYKLKESPKERSNKSINEEERHDP